MERLTAAGVHPDLLAINNGSKHGNYLEGEKISIDLDRTGEIYRAIHDRFGVSIAQHGITGTPLHLIGKFAEYGIRKGNVGTQWQNIAHAGLPPELMGRMRDWAKEAGKDIKFATKPFKAEIDAVPSHVRFVDREGGVRRGEAALPGVPGRRHGEDRRRGARRAEAGFRAAPKVRVVAGKWGGRTIRAPRGTSVRPTTDRVREAVFAILGDDVEGSVVLDLFAGTGAMAIESLSRGAAGAVLVESSPAALDALRANLAALEAEGARLSPPRLPGGGPEALREGEDVRSRVPRPPVRQGAGRPVGGAAFPRRHSRSRRRGGGGAGLPGSRGNAPGGVEGAGRPPVRRYADHLVRHPRSPRAGAAGRAETGEAMRTVAVYPGSFDPPTNGHLDIIERSSRVFSRVIVAVAVNLRKNAFFTPAERVRMLKRLTSTMGNVEVTSFRGLLVDFARVQEAHILVRGIRAISDFEYEYQMAHMNRKLDQEIDTVIMMTGERHSAISSNIVKEIAQFGGKIDDLVPPLVRDILFRKLKGAKRK